ncbi:hypothetical protein, partial [Brucella ceti]|uniref:hypothetical protein n=1 Tax=Brucella ceti TaxID=120577 RepID=UPI0035D4E7B1
KICFDPVPLLICKASSAHGCSPLTTLNQNFMQKGILECRQALSFFTIPSPIPDSLLHSGIDIRATASLIPQDFPKQWSFHVLHHYTYLPEND